jgi:hypothetical protein
VETWSSLEGMIDQYGLKKVLSMMSDICAEKADHIRSNWQDAALARQWENEARKLDTAASKVRV